VSLFARLAELAINSPDNAKGFAAAAYTNYEGENYLLEIEAIRLQIRNI